jgi:hypothetical protein
MCSLSRELPSVYSKYLPHRLRQIEAYASNEMPPQLRHYLNMKVVNNNYIYSTSRWLSRVHHDRLGVCGVTSFYKTWFNSIRTSSHTRLKSDPVTCLNEVVFTRSICKLRPYSMLIITNECQGRK